MIPLLLATGNQGKLHEFKSLLAGLDFLHLLSLKDLKNTEEIAEEGKSFLENARIKASAYRRRHGIENIVAEDSGLEVAALNNGPGIFSARYAGPDATDGENIKKLLGALRQARDREARFVSVVVCICADGEEHSFRGEVKGSILRQPCGNGGFGYDPVFYYRPLKRSFAELTQEEKNRVSHRGRALAALKIFLQLRFGGDTDIGSRLRG